MIQHSSLSIIRRMYDNPTGILYALQLRSALRDCRSVLDAGCGSQSNLRYICQNSTHTMGLDGHAASLEKARLSGTHDEYRQLDVRELSNAFPSGAFDACIALDVIEHLTKEEGNQFLKQLERIARKKVVVFTPNGFMPQGNTEVGDYQKHMSGWTADEMIERGYDVTGSLGLKILRGEYHKIRFKPKCLWLLLSILSDICYARYHYQTAAALFCVKQIIR